MRIVFGCLLFVLLASSGCVSKSTATAQAQAAFLAGQQQQVQAQSQGPVVSVRGDVRNPIVPWTEGLTLAQVIVAAEYQPSRNPQTIFVIRNGQSFEVKPRSLLSGQDVPLEAGDVVEIRR
jgi:hypothetical protein